MTDKEIKERGEVYSQLIEHPAFEYLVAEMREESRSILQTIGSDIRPGSDNLFEKGLRAGIERVIDTPFNAIREMQELKTSEDS